jgi:hypothetical protein
MDGATEDVSTGSDEENGRGLTAKGDPAGLIGEQFSRRSVELEEQCVFASTGAIRWQYVTVLALGLDIALESALLLRGGWSSPYIDPPVTINQLEAPKGVSSVPGMMLSTTTRSSSPSARSRLTELRVRPHRPWDTGPGRWRRGA